MPKRFISMAAILLLLSSLLFETGCGKKQHVSFTYSFAISPKKGEVLKNVTICLPFPTKNGKPMMEIFRSLQKHYKNYHLEDTPKLTLSIADTKYGAMLKVQVPELKQGVGLEGGLGFDEPSSNGSASPRFPIAPRLNPRGLKGYKAGHLCDSYIFTEFENARAIGLALTYDISSQSPSFLPLDYEPDDNYYSYIGWSVIPGGSEVLVKYFPDASWIKVPLADIGYDEDQL